ncbi:MAG: heat-inducible transcription repressor HrcA [Armatimonadetes bacterium]|nr:heat-inducible transcription repressor HrcA [Armatimonadota bacterium]
MELDPRKQALLQTVVVTYVERAEPVGSQFLASREGLGVRSATIRNELAEMTERGYLRQPHTSAGRVPSEQGYRYYVDHLMVWDRLSNDGIRAIRGAVKVSEGDLDQLLYQTCRVLSSLTRYTSVATPPAVPEPSVRQAHVVSLGPRRLLAVAVLDGGQVIHRICEAPRPVAPFEVTQLSNVLDELLRDQPLAGLPADPPLREELGAVEPLLRLVLQTLRRSLTPDETELVFDGARHMLEQPEFREANRVEPLIQFLEERRSAYQTLRSLLARCALTVSIGAENPHQALQEVSVVAARYEAGSGAAGWVGVLGPTRMHYEHAVSAVRYAAQTLSHALSRLAGE